MIARVRKQPIIVLYFELRMSSSFITSLPEVGFSELDMVVADIVHGLINMAINIWY